MWAAESAIGAMRLAEMAAADDKAFLRAVSEILDVTEATPPRDTGPVECLVAVLKDSQSLNLGVS